MWPDLRNEGIAQASGPQLAGQTLRQRGLLPAASLPTGVPLHMQTHHICPAPCSCCRTCSGRSSSSVGTRSMAVSVSKPGRSEQDEWAWAVALLVRCHCFQAGSFRKPLLRLTADHAPEDAVLVVKMSRRLEENKELRRVCVCLD